MRTRFLILCGCAAAILAALGDTSAAEILVSSRDSNEIYKFDVDTGKGSLFIGSKGTGLDGPVGMRYGPDGHLYVSNFFANNVSKYNGKTGALLGVFATTGLSSPSDLRFGPDGNLYVANFGSTTVSRFGGQTGAPLPADAGKAFASGGDLASATNLKFRGDTLYVSSFGSDKVLSYNIKAAVPAPSTQYIDAAVLSDEGAGPAGLFFHSDGNTYVAGLLSQQIGVFDTVNPSKFTTISTPFFTFPSDLLFTPDGRLLVSSTGLNAVLAFDPVTKQQLYVTGSNPDGLFMTAPSLTIAAQMLFVAIPGDTNENGVVDGADYTIWADSYLESSKLGAMGGDFNFNGFVDGADYTLWADNYAPYVPPALATAVPEPSSLVLATIGSLVAAVIVWRRRLHSGTDCIRAQ